MKRAILLLLNLSFSLGLTANLYMLQYDPLVLLLAFSEPTALPSFQLLYNNIDNLPYTLRTNDTVAKRF
jgi:hypothetical protein